MAKTWLKWPKFDELAETWPKFDELAITWPK